MLQLSSEESEERVHKLYTIVAMHYVHFTGSQMLTSVSLVLQARPKQPQRDRSQYHARGRKGLVTLSRFLCGTSRLARVQSVWLWSHAFELILTCETTESEDCSGEFASIYITPT